MNEQNSRSALEVAASNPRVAAVVAGSTTVVGAAAKLQVIQGWLSVASMAVGIFTAIIVLAIQVIRLEKALRDRSASEK